MRHERESVRIKFTLPRIFRQVTRESELSSKEPGCYSPEILLALRLAAQLPE
jgi:hypothetical protein